MAELQGPGSSRRKRTPTIKVRARREAIKRHLARGVSVIQIAKDFHLSERTARADVSAIRQAAGKELLERPLAEYGADVQREFAGVRELLLKRLYEAGDRNDNRALVALAGRFHENRERENAILQSLGILYKAPSRVLAAIRFEEAFDAIPEATMKAIAEAENPDKAMELFRLEVGEERAKQIFEPTPEMKRLPAHPLK